MAQDFYYPSTRKITTGARLKIAVLPFGIRTPTIYTLTLTRYFFSSLTPSTIYLKSNQAFYLSAETQLTFGSNIITVAEEIYVTTNETLISIIDVPNGVRIPINTTTTTEGLMIVYGCKNFTVSPDIQVIDTTNVSHGIEKEEKQTFNSKKISIDINEIYGDIGGYYLYSMWDNPIYRNYEFWFNCSYPDTSFKEGAALITSASTTTNQQGIKSFRLEARVQPGTYNSNIVV